MTNGAVILDVDGTLVDSNDAHARAWVEAFEAEGITVPFDRVRRCIGMGGDKLMPEVSGISEDSPLGVRIGDRRGDIFKKKYLPQIQPFPRVRELLQAFLNDGLSLAVASSAKEDELKALLARVAADDLISIRTSSDDADNSKPDPDIVEAALAEVKTRRAVMLGDTPYDIAAASSAGIPIVALECGGWTRKELVGAVAVYRDPADLLAQYAASAFAALAAGREPTVASIRTS
ncbi:MAG: HAD family hydrolase [Acidobacteria bacterium]|nr:HAD family hydrolase [Acidobacteriota bacterium]MCA1651531.1 HAD family hydrolase [Acidobacteriota bacterium]